MVLLGTVACKQAAPAREDPVCTIASEPVGASVMRIERDGKTTVLGVTPLARPRSAWLDEEVGVIVRYELDKYGFRAAAVAPPVGDEGCADRLVRLEPAR